ncbi:MAG TPA: Crp/Fnr family transcriptional regulator [Candidatus Elarobacter sp.]|jgi:hypothetical protein
MPSRQLYAGGNRLLDALPAAERAAVARHIDVVAIDSGVTTHEPGTSYEWVAFPIDAVLSVVTTLANGDTAEVGTIGNEGASGVEIAFGAPVLRTTICQVGGEIGRLRTTDFLTAIAANPTLDALIRATEKARAFFTEQMIVCNTMHAVEQRLSRWLLAVADRTSRNEYNLTQEFLAIMLGVRRATVTVAAQQLHEAGAISYARGVVEIVDRRTLESTACECYAETARIFDAALTSWRPRLIAERGEVVAASPAPKHPLQAG